MGLLTTIYNNILSKVFNRILSKKLRSKMFTGAAMLRTAMDAVRETYGDEGVEVVHKAFIKRAVKLGKERAMKEPDNSLNAFCSALENGCTGTHKWHKAA